MPKASPIPLRILVVNDTKLIADKTAERCRFMETLESFQAEIERITLLVGKQNGDISDMPLDDAEALDNTADQKK